VTDSKELGEQILAHLQLYEEMGVRWVRIPKLQKARAAGRPEKAAVPATKVSKPVARVESPKSLDPNLAPQPDPAGEALEAIHADLTGCKRCKLASTRKNIVFGSGNPNADLMFVGEAPGADEDEQGLPFVGRAGQLLTKIIESIGMKRQEVFICNIIKCRPPGNRNPEADEIAACEQFMFRQISAVKPKIICALGAYGAQTVLRTTEAIGRLRGRLIDYRGVKLIATYHPAYLLRNPIEKRKVWEDMLIVRKYLDSLQP
jgi:uracil-DNA glycosylase